MRTVEPGLVVRIATVEVAGSMPSTLRLPSAQLLQKTLFRGGEPSLALFAV